MTAEPKRRVLPDNAALLSLNKCEKAMEGLTQAQVLWVLQCLTALHTDDLSYSATEK